MSQPPTFDGERELHDQGYRLIAGIDEDGDAGGQEFRTGGSNGYGLTAIEAERDCDKGRLPLQVSHLGLRNSGPAGSAPDSR